MKNQEMDMNRQLKRELRFTRICCMISSLLTVCLLLGGAVVFGKLQPVLAFATEAQPVLEQISQLDVNAFNDTLAQVDTTLSDVDWQQVSETFDKLDVEAINSAIQGLDVEELSKAIENLNKASETLEGLSEKLSPFLSVF